MLDTFSSKDLNKFKELRPSEKNIIKIAKYISINFKHVNHSFEYKKFPFEQLNIFKLINIYGYGNCKHFAILFSFFMDMMNVKCDLIISKYKFFSHVFNIIYVNRKKYIIDTDFGIIEKNNKLIEFKESSFDKLIFKKIYSFCKINKNEKYKNKKRFKNDFYFEKLEDEINFLFKSFKNIQAFDLYSYKYPYKQAISKYFSDIYFYNEPYPSHNFKIISKNYTPKRFILKNRVFKTNDHFIENWLIEISVNDYGIVLNNFPFLVLDLKVIMKINSNFKFLSSGNISSFRSNRFIFKNRKRYSYPIYNFAIKSNNLISKIQLIINKSKLGNKLKKFIN